MIRFFLFTVGCAEPIELGQDHPDDRFDPGL
jgi:hypothetical protein